ncbi:MAG: mannose-1-phosphate guanylyltransferase/mannose-6-phosphate isomerase [Actinobacteria bacterium]|nr:mannose-1-phosphate guanylyltransferase/mannose-6-phosphate isomerase [Actinomycetota bacterium]
MWPVSRAQQPKQLLPLVETRSMLRMTIDRVTALPNAKDPIVVCSANHDHLVAAELADAGYSPRLILEPFGRNTAPAVAFAALASDPRDVLLVIPADHLIPDEAAFSKAAAEAISLASRGLLVTFGVIPTHPETGYGYVRIGDPLSGTASTLAEFVEKPDIETAHDYVSSGNYLWNSGMFALGAATYLDQLRSHAPEMADAVTATWERASRNTDGTVVLDREAFEKCPSDSIDYAVMEHTEAGAVVPLDAGWSDVGSWAAVWDIAPKDKLGTATTGDVLVSGVRNSYVRSDGPLVAVSGVSDLIVVATDDAVLVVPRGQTQRVKEIVDNLAASNRPELLSHLVTEHPWGSLHTVTTDGSVVTMDLTANTHVPADDTPLGVHVVQSGEVTIGETTYTAGQSYTMMDHTAMSTPAGVTSRIVVTRTE